MDTENTQKRNMVSMFFVEFIRLSDVVRWFMISFLGFILGLFTTSITTFLTPLFVFIVSTFCIMSFTFAINNYYDADSDRNNPRRMHKNAMASGKMSKKTGMICSILFVVVSLSISFLFKFEIFLLCLLILFWMLIYSTPPLRLKGKPGIDIVWHFVAFLLIVIWGSFIAGSITTMTWLIAISLGIDSCIAQVWNHVSDYTFDKNTGTTTFVVLVGQDTAKKTIKILVGIHIIVLIPLILLYSLSYLATIIVLISGAIIGFFILQPQKEKFPSKRSFESYFAVVIGGSVYASCIIYHILFIVGMPTLGLLHGIGIL